MNEELRKFLKRILESRKKEFKKMELKFDESKDADEVRSIGETLKKLKDEIIEVEKQLEEDDINNNDDNIDVVDEEGRSTVFKDVCVRGGKPISSYVQKIEHVSKREDNDVFASLEYRNAFAKYVKTGDSTDVDMITRSADDGMITTTDIGKIIPTTIMQEVIKELKSYGNLYDRVRKLNVAGGVEFPIEDLIPQVSWVTETVPSSDQGTPELKTSVSFGYHIAEAKIGQSLLSSIVSLPMLESELVKLLTEAFVKEFDNIIISGSGSGKPLGILNDTRVTNSETQNITMNASNASNWVKWRENLFSKIPLAYRSGGVLIMTVGTWEGLICTMKDSNNRPLYSESFDVNTGETVLRFNGKEVLLVENDLGIYDFDVATSGQPYMIYTKLENYAINSNMQLGFKRYYDDNKNKFVNKGLVIMDGKLLDSNGTFIIKK